MALTTQTEKVTQSDSTPEYEVKLDFEGKGYLAKKVKKEEPKIEEQPKYEIKKKKRGKK